MNKIIIFTNESELFSLAPDTPLFWEGKEKILGLRGNILSDYTEEDSIFIVDDTITPTDFRNFYGKLFPNNKIFILYHQKGGAFDKKSVFKTVKVRAQRKNVDVLYAPFTAKKNLVRDFVLAAEFERRRKVKRVPVACM